MSQPPAAIVAFLESCSTGETAHRANRSLLAHLIATWRVLDTWQAPRVVCAAGLLHSVYGTDAFDVATLPHDEPSRERVRRVAGVAAEALAYAFCAMDRELFLADPSRSRQRNRFTGGALALTPGTIRGLAEILLANEVDLARAKKGEDRRRVARKVAPVYGALAGVLPRRVRSIAIASGFGA